MSSKLPPLIPWEKIRDMMGGAVEQAFHTVFASMDGLEREVDLALEKDVQSSRRRLGLQIVHEAAREAALISAATSSVDLLPARWPFLVPTMVSEFTLGLRLQLAMLLRLSTLYGPDRPRPERQHEAMRLLAAFGYQEDPASARAWRRVGKDAARVGSSHLSRSALTKVMNRLLRRYMGKRFLALVPVVGAGSSGALNYWWTLKLGEAAVAHLEREREHDRPADPMDEGKIQDTRRYVRCLLQAMTNAAKCDRHVSDGERQLVHEAMLLFGVTDEDRDDILENLRDLDHLPRLPEQEVVKLTPRERKEILEHASRVLQEGSGANPHQFRYQEILRRQLQLEEEPA